jgi:hypothetical protein
LLLFFLEFEAEQTLVYSIIDEKVIVIFGAKHSNRKYLFKNTNPYYSVTTILN